MICSPGSPALNHAHEENYKQLSSPQNHNHKYSPHRISASSCKLGPTGQPAWCLFLSRGCCCFWITAMFIHFCIVYGSFCCPFWVKIETIDQQSLKYLLSGLFKKMLASPWSKQLKNPKFFHSCLDYGAQIKEHKCVYSPSQITYERFSNLRPSFYKVN